MINKTPKKSDPLTPLEMKEASKEFLELFSVVRAVMPADLPTEDLLKIMEVVSKLAHKKRAEKIENEADKFGFNKLKQEEEK